MRALVVSWALALAACASVPTHRRAGPLSVTMLPVKVTRGGAPRIGALTLLAAYELRSEHPRFGGLSSLALSGDGRTLVLLSDRGHWLSARLVLAPNGALRSLKDWQIQPIRDASGAAVQRPWHDAEAIARAPDGAWLIGFEWNHRIWRYPRGLLGSRPVSLRLPPALREAPGNGSLEAIAALPDGRLLFICEHFMNQDGTHRGWIGKDGALRPLSYVAEEGFAPTDLAVVPGSGDVLVLERAFSVLRGNRARILRLRAMDLRPGARLQGEELARLEPPMRVDNFEGLAVQRHATGALLVYLVSDDNFSVLQRTLLYQGSLPL